MNQRAELRSHASEVSQRGVRQALARLLMTGLLLGLPFAGLVVGATSEAAQEALPPDPAPTRCKSYHHEVVIDFSGEGIVFIPSRCLEVGGTVRFINLCEEETLVTVHGPEPYFGLLLPREGKTDRVFKTEGSYIIKAAEGCPEMPHDSRTGTLEVATGPGPEEGASP
ncbi:cupredoxin domain-containing protein [Pyxidicoccus caerfyrddinensis]|uniref:cupredoxin domain-containing protein n=1 Tax=Pyxidicoccus caerfyrddinensis TaxID=2709663 RepID=UPI0013DAA766|nr:hypothetical protein [Pyxidicoccus caerfyrddinensis]